MKAKGSVLAIVLLVVQCLAGCSAPTATPTPATLAEIDLRSVLTQVGELPGDLSPCRFQRAFGPWWSDFLPDPENFTFYDLSRSGSVAGEGALLLYESGEEIDAAYSYVVGTFEQVQGEAQDGGGIQATIETISDLGDRARAEVVRATFSRFGVSYNVRVQLVFVSCSALAYVRLDNPADLGLAVAYAGQLEDILAPLVCR